VNTTHRQHLTADRDALEARFGLRVASRLSDAELPADVTERLRFAREQALTRRKPEPRLAAPIVGMAPSGAAVLGGPPRGRADSGWWPLAWAVPAIVLGLGLFFIHEWHADRQVRLTAEIDSALLADDLPPSAYADPGFAEFLRSPKE
jgi:hypothetical protein